MFIQTMILIYFVQYDHSHKRRGYPTTALVFGVKGAAYEEET